MGFRRGQKVECVDNTFRLEACALRPEIGAKYTIDLVREYRGREYVTLVEIINQPCKCHIIDNEPLAYDAQGFRAIVENGTKSEHVTRMIDDARKQIETRVPERA